MRERKIGQRQAIRWMIQWLHDRANMMNDLHAKAVLNLAAFNLGAQTRGPDFLMQDLVQTPSPQVEPLSGHQDFEGAECLRDSDPNFIAENYRLKAENAKLKTHLRQSQESNSRLMDQLPQRSSEEPQMTEPEPQHPFEPSLNAPTLPVDGSKAPEAIVPHPRAANPLTGH